MDKCFAVIQDENWMRRILAWLDLHAMEFGSLTVSGAGSEEVTISLRMNRLLVARLITYLERSKRDGLK